MEANSNINNTVFNSFIKNPQKTSTNPITTVTPHPVPPENQEKSRNSHAGYYISAAAAAALAAGVTLVFSKRRMRGLYEENWKLRRLTYETESIKKESEYLKKENTSLKQEAKIARDSAKSQIEDLESTLRDIPDEHITNGKHATEDLNKTREKISKPLEYNPLNPPIEKTSSYTTTDKGFEHKTIPAASNIRTHLPDFKPPTLADLKQNGRVDFEIPTEKPQNIKATISPDASEIKCPTQDIGEYKDAGVKIRYGKNTVWSEKKVARDLMQNFYDGHGHTLEGVKVQIERNHSKGTYKVRVSGQGEFNHKSLEDFGAGEKSENPRNAGGFGEGSKIMSARMIAAFDVPEVKFASSNWQLTYKGDAKNLSSNINKKLEVSSSPIKGNYVEFETANEKLVDAVLESTNYFYHPQNPDFKALTFENEHFGFKVLGDNPDKDKGSLYITQRFEYGDTEAWENATENVSLIFKRKPTQKGIIDSNRDRIKISPDDIQKLAAHFAETMSDEELAKAISSLETLWDKNKLSKCSNKFEDLAGVKFLKGLIKTASARNIKLKFREDQKFVSIPNYHDIDKGVLQNLMDKGYTLCFEELRDVGVISFEDLRKQLRNHGVKAPTPTEIKKIQIINEAARYVTESMNRRNGSHNVISTADSVKPTYLFEREPNDPTLAQAITFSKWDNENEKIKTVYLGHWITRDYLNSSDFADILATRLHEATHQHGGDGDKNFGYKLTDIIADYNRAITEDPILRKNLSILNKLWEELPRTAKKPETASKTS
jgi:hypothetical protein